MAILALTSWVAGPASAQGYRVQAGDTLRIEVMEDDRLNRTVLVAPDGRISLPLAGAIQASGRTVEQIQADLVGLLARNFVVTPTIFVGLERRAPERRAAAASTARAPAPAAPQTISVFIVGEANKTGEMDVAPGTTILQMFAVMGGFTRFAATRRIQLRRDGTTYTVSYPAIAAGRSGNGSVALADGDVLVIPERRLFE